MSARHGGHGGAAVAARYRIQQAGPNALLCWPIHVRHCEVQGVCNPRTGEFYRYRYMPFGLTHACGIRQRWACMLMELVERQ